MAYKVTWTYGKGESESEEFEDRHVALQTASTRAAEYARLHNKCEAVVVDGDGLLQLNHTATWNA